MSGKPYLDGVKQFKFFLKQMSDSAVLTNNLEDEIAKAQSKRIDALESYTKAKQNLFKLIEQMDIKSDGNAGWEGRMSWFLIELQKQLNKKDIEEGNICS